MKTQLICLFLGLFFLLAAHITWVINPTVWVSVTLTVCGIVNLFLCTVQGITKGNDDDDDEV